MEELLARLDSAGVQELAVRRGELRVRVSRADGVPAAMPAPAGTAAASAPVVGPPPGPPAAEKAVTAPLTGIFYRGPSPQAPPFAQVGSVVAAGDVIGLIEAMKLFNEIRSPLAGRVKRLFVENGQLVRAHQPILEME
ncbi:MAG TPA: acetyl-CoA carboxylase [Candidatus Limnocylindrales bacterium]|nr:acetyl-CoA carboxylase [Candidatus Limnocylindrales bacterium]